MWALIEDGSITKHLSGNRGITIGDTQYSRNIFSLWSKSEREAKGIYEVVWDNTNKKDEAFYTNTNVSYAFADGVVTASYGSATAKSLADVTDEDDNVTLGLKSNAKNQATTQANGYLQGFDWLIQRKVTASTAIPSAVITYMAAIRTDHGDICTALDGAANMAAFIALHTTTYNADNTVNVIAKVQSWTTDANVKSYRR